MGNALDELAEYLRLWQDSYHKSDDAEREGKCARWLDALDKLRAEHAVPREPTPAMSAEGDALAFPDHWQQLGVTADDVWRTMYDAASKG